MNVLKHNEIIIISIPYLIIKFNKEIEFIPNNL